MSKSPLKLLFDKRQPSRPWLFVVCGALPALQWLWTFTMYNNALGGISAIRDWGLPLMATVCFLQVFRPTVAGWACVLAAYGIALRPVLGTLIAEISNYGSEEHSAWEGWPAFSMTVSAVATIMLILTAVALSFPKTEADMRPHGRPIRHPRPDRPSNR